MLCLAKSRFKEEGSGSRIYTIGAIRGEKASEAELEVALCAPKLSILPTNPTAADVPR